MLKSDFLLNQAQLLLIFFCQCKPHSSGSHTIIYIIVKKGL